MFYCKENHNFTIIDIKNYKNKIVFYFQTYILDNIIITIRKYVFA